MTHVTVAGQSAGGNAVWAHLVSPAAAGLFERALSMSGNWSVDWNWATGDDWPAPHIDLPSAEGNGTSFARAVGCDGADARAYHGSDLQYLFRSPDNGTGLTDPQLALSDHIIDYVTSFARFGAPVGRPAWPAYRRSQDAVQSLTPGAIAPTRAFAAEHQCDFWRRLRGI